jgi:dienelactone hydrolase
MQIKRYARYLLLARVLLVVGAILVVGVTFAEDAPLGASGLNKAVVFTDYSPLAGRAELARRTLSPLQALHAGLNAARSGPPLPEQSIELANERFAFYVPTQAPPPKGYALLVFVPPWDEAGVPRDWLSALDRHAMIYVSAAHSDNSASVLERREPLALLGAANMLRRYPIDPERVYIGGFSGGARVAERLALAYPDVFHGALLNSSSDPLGDGPIALPAADLLRAFQEGTRIVFATGALDHINISKDVATRRSFKEWCIADFDIQVVPWRAHELLDGFAFDRALDSLARHARPDPEELASCRARIDKELAAQLDAVASLFVSGKADAARRLLVRIDARYGGLAAPRSIELAGR